MSRNYESSGPDVKIRGTAMHIAEKYASLARDAMAAGDIVAAENYLQHAEHYNRIIMAAQAQNAGAPGLDGANGLNGGGRFQPEVYQRDMDGGMEDGDADEYMPQRPFHERVPNYNQHQQPQPYIPQQAFPQNQPQPIVPANGAAGHAGENQGIAHEAERGPRRRRRRPMGEPKGYNGSRNGSNHLAGPSLNGNPAPAPSDSTPDEAAS